MLRSAMCACFSLGTTVFYMLLTCTYQGRSVWLFWYIARSDYCTLHRLLLAFSTLRCWKGLLTSIQAPARGGTYSECPSKTSILVCRWHLPPLEQWKSTIDQY